MNIQKPLSTNLLPPDRLGKRLQWGIIASVLVNILCWHAVAAMAKRPLYVPPRPVEITRVIIDKQGKKIEKVVKKEDIKKKVQTIKRQPPKPKPIIKPIVYHQPQPKVTPKPPSQPPPGAHVKVFTAPDKSKTPSPDPTALPGGNAPVGVPLEHQMPGNGTTNPPVAVKQPDPAPVVKQPDPAPVVKQPDPAPVVKQPDPAPVVKQPDPAPVVKQPDPPPVHKGPTKDAEPTDQVKPEIPDDLKHGDFKSFVRVKVEIDADGSATTTLRTSSGNSEIDQRVLDALKKWKWKPALSHGVPIKSTQLFKFEFLVE